MTKIKNIQPAIYNALQNQTAERKKQDERHEEEKKQMTEEHKSEIIKKKIQKFQN
jgi:hypothetical protein